MRSSERVSCEESNLQGETIHLLKVDLTSRSNWWSHG